MNVRKMVSLACLAGVVTACTMVNAMKIKGITKSITVDNKTWEEVAIEETKKTRGMGVRSRAETITIGPSGSHEFSWNQLLSVITLKLKNDELTFFRKAKPAPGSVWMSSPKWEDIGRTLTLGDDSQGKKLRLKWGDNPANYQYEVDYKDAHSEK